MTGRYFQVDGEEIFVRMSDGDSFIKENQTVVFIHGLGESGDCYADASRWMHNVNIIIPDLPGYGLSSASENGDHSTENQAKRVLQLIDNLKCGQVSLVGHSWGGDVGILACQMGGDLISRYFCIEGDLHVDNVFISHMASQAFKSLDSHDFENWLLHKEFPEIIRHWHIPAAERYIAAVRLCNPSVFGETASEIAAKCKNADSNSILDWGNIFAELPMQKIYCWGGRSINKDSSVIKFLDFNNISHRCFAESTHWIMDDEPEKFYRFLSSF